MPCPIVSPCHPLPILLTVPLLFPMLLPWDVYFGDASSGCVCAFCPLWSPPPTLTPPTTCPWEEEGIPCAPRRSTLPHYPDLPAQPCLPAPFALCPSAFPPVPNHTCLPTIIPSFPYHPLGGGTVAFILCHTLYCPCLSVCCAGISNTMPAFPLPPCCLHCCFLHTYPSTPALLPTLPPCNIWDFPSCPNFVPSLFACPQCLPACQLPTPSPAYSLLFCASSGGGGWTPAPTCLLTTFPFPFPMPTWTFMAPRPLTYLWRREEEGDGAYRRDLCLACCP